MNLGSKDIKWLIKVIFESNNISGSDIEQAVLTITKLKEKLKESLEDENRQK
jgi:hypothetical protein